MSREIGFRAWDIKNKRFVNIVRLVLDQFGVLDYADVVFKGKIYKLYPSEIVLEQDTGLKDKNGKKIYEGDIVRVSYGYNYEVRQFRTGAWRIGRDDLCVWADSSEVIGNIHEEKINV